MLEQRICQSKIGVSSPVESEDTEEKEGGAS